MKTGASLILTFALLLPAGGLSHAQQSPSAAAAPGIHAAADWEDAAQLEKRLATSIRQNLKGIDKASIQAFLAVPENRLMLAQWQLVRTENSSDTSRLAQAQENLRRDIARIQQELAPLKEMLPAARGSERDVLQQRMARQEAELRTREVELNSPHSMKEALASPEAVKLFRALVNDVDWLEQLLYTGESAAPGRAVAILAALAAKDPSILQGGMPRAIATATAVEWAKYNWSFAPALERARFYMENDRDNRFNAGFRKLPFWQLRIVCGCKGDNQNGSVESLRWALDNVHLPADQYPGSCWQASYLLDNLFGDSVHGAHYYAVYDDVYGSNAVQRTREVGGVCGSLSHFGAFSALANGVPALTAGEPGHCAYIVLVNGRWTPAYSLTWQRGLHWQVWKGVHLFSSLHMATELYGDEQREATQLSNACRSLGNMFATEGKGSLARNCLRASVKTQPLNYPAWRDYAAVVQAQSAGGSKSWETFNADVCRLLVPRYPEMAAELLKAHAYPHMKTALSNKQLAPAFSAFWQAVGTMGPDRWPIEALCNTQLDIIKSRLSKPGPEQAANAANNLYSLILRRTASKPAYATAILAWGNGIAAGMDAKTQKAFLHSTLSALSKSGKDGAGGEDASARDRMLGQALLGAAKMRDRNSFQAIGQLLSGNYRQPQAKLPEWEPFPGKLVSRGGLLQTSSTCGHDDPAAHWGVLEPTGGRFHTKDEKDAWAVVQLPKLAVLTGVVTIAPHGNLWRLSDMKVQYSESGRDNDWHDAGAMPAPTQQRINRLDLQESKPRARFIRILRPGGPQFFHLNAIFVYGIPAS